MKEKGKERSQFYYTSPAANFASEGLDASQSIPIKPSIIEMQEPMKTVLFRPNLSGSQATESAPGMAPPVKAETTPPVWEEVGVPM